MASSPDSDLIFAIAGRSRISVYRFGIPSKARYRH
jgi:hypothetical protein